MILTIDQMYLIGLKKYLKISLYRNEKKKMITKYISSTKGHFIENLNKKLIIMYIITFFKVNRPFIATNSSQKLYYNVLCKLTRLLNEPKT